MIRRLLFTGISTMTNHAGQFKLYFLADLLARKGIPVSVLVPDLPENRAFLKERPHIESHFYRPGSVPVEIWRKARIVRRGCWSGIWVLGVGLRSVVLRTGGARAVPLIKDFDEFPSMIGSFNRRRRAYLRWIEKRMIAQADAFTAASAFLENAVRQQRPELGNRLLRLRVAISRSEHRVDALLVARLRAQYGAIPTFLYVGSANRFYEDQIDEIIQFSLLLTQRRFPARVRILGAGPDLEYFKNKAREAGVAAVLEFAGHVDRHELASHMEAAQVLLFPFPASPFNVSRCPTKLFHYIAANRPIVTNRTGEVAQLLGDNAWYYPEGDVEALADQCVNALVQGATFKSELQLDELVWEARAVQFSDWLNHQGWLPARLDEKRNVIGVAGSIATS